MTDYIVAGFAFEEDARDVAERHEDGVFLSGDETEHTAAAAVPSDVGFYRPFSTHEPTEREQTAIEAKRRPDFVDYLRDEVLTLGTYTIKEDHRFPFGDVAVGENPENSGFICGGDIQRAGEDDRVEISGISEGWLLLNEKATYVEWTDGSGYGMVVPEDADYVVDDHYDEEKKKAVYFNSEDDVSDYHSWNADSDEGKPHHDSGFYTTKKPTTVTRVER